MTKGNKFSPFGDLNLRNNPLFDSKDENTRDKRRAFTTTQKKEILVKQDYRCAGCGEKLGVAVHYDHRKPWSAGGKTEVRNGRALCPNCHEKKTHSERLHTVDKKRKDTSFGSLLGI